MTTITVPRATVEQALEALEQDNPSGRTATITALRAALAQPVPEPVAHNPDPYHLSRILHELAGSASMCWEHVDRAGTFQSTQAAEFVAAAIAEIRQRMNDATPQQPAPEPLLTIERLRDALVASRIVPPAAVEDPDEYDDGVTLFRIEALYRRIT